MKNLNKIISITLCSALLLTDVPVKADAASNPSVTKKMTLTVGQSKMIKVKGTVKKKSFKSKNKKIATVTQKGKVTAKKAGTCKVTVTVKYKKAKKLITKKYTCNVTVNGKQEKGGTSATNPTETETPQGSVPDEGSIPSTAPSVSGEPIEETKETSTPDVKVTPSSDASRVPDETPSVSAVPDTTQAPSVPPIVSNEPTGETKAPSIPDVKVTPSPDASSVPDETITPSGDPSSTPIVSSEPVGETKEPSIPDVKVTPSPTGSTNPGEVPDVPGSPDTTQEPSVTPSVTNEPTGETKEPSTPDETNPPETTPSVKPEEPNIPVVTPPSEDEFYNLDSLDDGWCHHKYPGVEVELGGFLDGVGFTDLCYTNPTETTWYVIRDAALTGANRSGYLYPICSKCEKPASIYYCYDPYREDEFSYNAELRFSYDGLTGTYTQWNPEPSEVQEGILDIYQGVNIYDMTEEEKEKNYKTISVIFSDGKTDKFYYTENLVSDKLESLRVVAKSTAEKIGSVTYPKYEVKTIDLGNGETTKVYGYYDREMADEVFRMVNEYRVENGLNELRTSDLIKEFADIRSSEAFYTEMYNQQNTDYEYGGHERPNKTSCKTVIGDLYAAYGENLLIHTLIEDYQAGGLLQKIEITPENIMQSFKDSEGHNANMLNTRIEGLAVSIFIGYPQNKDGTFRSYKMAVPVQSFMY